MNLITRIIIYFRTNLPLVRQEIGTLSSLPIIKEEMKKTWVY